MLEKLLRFSQVSKLEYEEKENEKVLFKCNVSFLLDFYYWNLSFIRIFVQSISSLLIINLSKHANGNYDLQIIYNTKHGN